MSNAERGREGSEVPPSDARPTALLREAVELCSKSLAIREYDYVLLPSSSGEDISKILPDIKRAIEMDPANKALFKGDPDLDAYKDKPEVAELLS